MSPTSIELLTPTLLFIKKCENTLERYKTHTPIRRGKVMSKTVSGTVENGFERPHVALKIWGGKVIWELICSGKRAIALRKGKISFEAGDTLVLYNESQVVVLRAVVTEVKYLPLNSVPMSYLRKLGLKDLKHALHVGRKYWPTLGPDSVVTIVQWDQISGSLVQSLG